MEQEWQRQQRETFLKWMNTKLRGVAEARSVGCLEDLSDGVALCQLMESLFPQAQMPRYNKQPRMNAHKLDNLAIVFRCLENAQVRLLTKPQNVMEANQTMVLGLLWTLILEFDINRVMRAAAASAAVEKSKNSFNFQPGQAKDSLLGWVRGRVGRYGMVPQNFDRDFCDGNVLLALIHSLRPDLINWQALDRSNAANNIALALATAERQMGIPPLLDPAMLLGGYPDEKAVMTYVVQFLRYQQENQGLIDQISQRFGQMALEDEVRRQEEMARQHALLEQQRRQQAALEEQRRQQEEQRRHQALLEEQRRQQALLEEQRRQQALLEEQRRQLEEQRRQQAALEEQKRQLEQQRQQMALLEQQRRDMARQQAMLEEQKRQMELLQQQKQLEEQRRQMEAQHQQALEEQRRQIALQRAHFEEQQREQYRLKLEAEAQQIQMQMAAEVARMNFFKALQQQHMEGIGLRNYVLFVDKSGSMAGSRWSEVRKTVISLCPSLAQACPQGFSLCFFNDEWGRVDGIRTVEKVHQYFAAEKPEGGTNLSGAVERALDTHFQRNRGCAETWLIITDGRPDRPAHVYELLKGAGAKFAEASTYLKNLRGALPFIDTVTQEELPKRDFSSLFSRK